jgi:hypothetical protein
MPNDQPFDYGPLHAAAMSAVRRGGPAPSDDPQERERQALASVTRARTARQQQPERPAYRSRYTGPVRDRQVINGQAVVSREELDDFRRQFGADKTLRDLLNADKGLRPRGSAAAVPAAAVAQAEPPGVDPEAVLSQAEQALAAEQRQREFAELMRPGRDAIEPIAPELALLRVPALISALRGGRAAPVAMTRREPTMFPGQAQDAVLMRRGVSAF